MFGLGSWEVILIFLVALLLFGKRLPGVARSIGRSINSLKKGLSETEFDDEKGGSARESESLPPPADDSSDDRT